MTFDYLRYGTPTMSGEEMTAFFRDSFYRQYGGKEAYERRMEEERIAREAMPKVPELKDLLALVWAAFNGETWSALTEVERHVRLTEMNRVISAAANPHYHS